MLMLFEPLVDKFPFIKDNMLKFLTEHICLLAGEDIIARRYHE